jgi:hypothetical protein
MPDIIDLSTAALAARKEEDDTALGSRTCGRIGALLRRGPDTVFTLEDFRDPVTGEIDQTGIVELLTAYADASASGPIKRMQFSGDLVEHIARMVTGGAA